MHGDRREGAIRTVHRKGVGVGGAGGKLVVGGVGDVGPGTTGADGELAVAAGGVGLGDEGGGAVDVADAQAAGGAQRSIGLGEVGDVGGQHGGIVGAEDLHADRREGAVGTAHREGVGVGGAGGELVVGGIGDVGPGTAAADGELAVAAGGVGLRDEGGGAVDVADAQGA